MRRFLRQAEIRTAIRLLPSARRAFVARKTQLAFAVSDRDVVREAVMHVPIGPAKLNDIDPQS